MPWNELVSQLRDRETWLSVPLEMGQEAITPTLEVDLR